MNAFYTKDHLVNEGLKILIEKIANNYEGWIESIKSRDGKDAKFRDMQAENFRNNLRV